MVEGLGPRTYPDGETLDLLKQATVRMKQIGDRSKPLYATLDPAIDVRVRGSVVPLTREAAKSLFRCGLVSSEGCLTWSLDQFFRLPSLFRLDENQIQVFIKRLDMSISLVSGDMGF